MIKNGSKKQYWLGGRRSSGWVTGEKMVYTNWQPGEPNNYRGKEDYIQMLRLPNPKKYRSDALGKWNDITYNNVIEDEKSFFSTNYIGFVCEWD